MKLSEFSASQNQKEMDDAKQSLQGESLEETYSKIKDLPPEQLERLAIEEVAKQKQNGTFSYEKLAALAESLRGSMGEAEFANLKRIIDLLK